MTATPRLDYGIVSIETTIVHQVVVHNVGNVAYYVATGCACTKQSVVIAAHIFPCFEAERIRY